MNFLGKLFWLTLNHISENSVKFDKYKGMKFCLPIIFLIAFFLISCAQYREQVVGKPALNESVDARPFVPATVFPLSGPEKERIVPSTIPTARTTTTTTVASLTLPSSPQMQSSSVENAQSSALESGMIIPTIYYLPVIYNDLMYCLPSNKVPVVDTRGQILTKICSTHYKDCALQGSCVVIEKDQRIRISVSSVRLGVTTFSRVAESTCPNGQTGAGICVDPFHSIAADLSIYKLGDVIFVPAIAGIKLPDESQHSGYFIVRDTGSAIKGKGRFDFYTGYYGLNHPKNVFVKYQLGDKNTRLPYYKVVDTIAQKVRSSRNFPR